MVREDEPRRSRAWFGRGLIAAFVLLAGGCVAVVASISDPTSGLADDDEFRLSLVSCDVIDGIPVGSGMIRSTNDELRSFRVEVSAFDNATGEIVGSSSRIVRASTEQPQPFDVFLIDPSDPTPSLQPGSISCAARVFRNS